MTMMERATAGLSSSGRSTADERPANLRDAACSFHHEALFYEGENGFLDGTLPFVNEALAAGEPLLVAIRDVRAQLLKQVLGEDAGRLRFLDMRQLARNPARIIPAWHDFLEENAADGRLARGIGEALWAGRSEPEVSECQRYEALLNLAFQRSARFSLLCPYDIDGLEPSVIEAAQISHPFLTRDGRSRESERYLSPGNAPGPFEGSLPAPASTPEELAFTGEGLAAVRAFVFRQAVQAQLAEEACEDLVLAINELVTNSVQHGGGGGILAIWTEGETLFCEVRDRGQITDPLAGRIPPPLDQHGGRGLWLANHLCDLVQIRSTRKGNVVRVLKRP
jgi:anti-sigma regulatory factor (Ser/Thr protein kinase)